MLDTSGRKLFHSRFPMSRSPQIPGSSFNKVHYPSNVNSPLADAETHKNPSLPLYPSNANRSLADVETHKNPSLPYYPSRILAPTHAQNRFRWISIRRKFLMIVSVIVLLMPSVIFVFEVVNAAILYNQMQSGIAHLQAVEHIFRGGPNGSIANYFDTNKLRQAQVEIATAHADFASLSDRLDHDGSIGLVSSVWPAQISTARALGHIAIDATAAAQQLVKTAIVIAPSVAPALMKSSSSKDELSPKPYITPASFQEINKALDAIAPLVHDISIQARGLSLDTLPITRKQRQMIASFLPFLPVLDAGLSQEHELRNMLGWVIGVDGPRSFLVEPMDRAELRATGGFTGQFGELILNGGHLAPLKLKNIGKYEENHTAEGSPPDKTVYPKVVDQNAPAPYSSWWPIANFGLRDANLSADFSTSARIAVDRYDYEFGKKLDGVIIFTPTLIKQILHVTGPITIPAYKETITEYNLEDRLHYYQLNNQGVRKQQIIEHVEDNQQARKLFTQRVTTTLISTVMHLPIDKLPPMVSEMLHSMKTKDLQVYVTNPQLEAWIGKYGSTASLDRSSNHDGLFIVQSNLSANKASQYVTTAVQDTITLDGKGGATHNMQMTLAYQQKGDVYGLDTYRDYVRVYVPVNSQLLTGNGFDQYDRPYCGDAKSGYRLCSQNVYGDGSLVCSSTVEIGYATSYLNDPYMGQDHPLDVTGPPQNQQSDEAGRAMFGGWIVIPKNCTMKVTLSWYVPPMDQHSYRLLIQAQAGVFAPLDLTVQPAPGTCLSNRGNALHFSGLMDGEDTTFTVKQQGSKCSL